MLSTFATEEIGETPSSPFLVMATPSALKNKLIMNSPYRFAYSDGDRVCLLAVNRIIPICLLSLLYHIDVKKKTWNCIGSISAFSLTISVKSCIMKS